MHAECYIYHGRLWWLFFISVTCPDVTVFDVEGSFSGLSTSIISTHPLSPSAILQFPFWRDNTPIAMLGTTGNRHWPRKKPFLLSTVSQMDQGSQQRIRIGPIKISCRLLYALTYRYFIEYIVTIYRIIQLYIYCSGIYHMAFTRGKGNYHSLTIKKREYFVFLIST